MVSHISGAGKSRLERKNLIVLIGVAYGDGNSSFVRRYDAWGALHDTVSCALRTARIPPRPPLAKCALKEEGCLSLGGWLLLGWLCFYWPLADQFFFRRALASMTAGAARILKYHELARHASAPAGLMPTSEQFLISYNAVSPTAF